MISLRYREHLPGYVAEEFDSLVAQLRGFLSESFNEDGTLIGLDTGLGTVPIGVVEDFAGPTAPTGWLVCNGGAISRVTYKSLFEVIGTTWGAGDGSTTFNLPDFRGRFRLGKAASGTGSTLGTTGGSLDHTHTIPSDGSHGHTVNSHTHTIPADGAHDHGGVTALEAQAGISVAAGADGIAAPGRFGLAGGHTHVVTAAVDHDHDGVTGAAAPDTGLGGSHDHGGTTNAGNPPFAVVITIIFAGV